MNTSTFIQWWKEVRAVLPIWVGAMVTLWLYSLSNLFGNDFGTQTIIFTVGSVVVCSFVYAREFQDRTLIWQFLQPVNRLTVLGRKFGVALALQVLLCAWYGLLAKANWRGDQHALEFGCLVSTLAVTSCCLWAALIRNPMNSMVVAFLVPVAISMIVTTQLQAVAERIAASSSGMDVGRVMIGIWLGGMMIYAIICAGLTVLIWRRLQLAGESNSVSRLDAGVMTRLMGDKAYRLRPVWRSLVRKELGLIRFMFWIFGAYLFAAVVFGVVDLTVTHMIAVAQSKLLDGEYLPKYTGIVSWQSSIRAVAVALFVLLMSLVPLLCGALAFTEETYLGTRAWELCQPIRSRAQWLVKLVTSLTSSVALGLLVPGVIIYLFRMLHIAGMDEQQFDPGSVLQAVTLHLMLFGVAAWCATWSRTTVVAIMKAFLVVALFVFLVGGITGGTYYRSAQFQMTFEVPDWRIVAVAVAFFAVIASALNFRFIQVPTRRWAWQGVGLALLALAAFSPYLIDRFLLGL